MTIAAMQNSIPSIQPANSVATKAFISASIHHPLQPSWLDELGLCRPHRQSRHSFSVVIQFLITPRGLGGGVRFLVRNLRIFVGLGKRV